MHTSSHVRWLPTVLRKLHSILPTVDPIHQPELSILRRCSFEQSESRKAHISRFPCPGGTGSEPSSGRAQDILRSSGEPLVNLGSLGNQTQGGPLSCRSSGKLLVTKRVSDFETQE